MALKITVREAHANDRSLIVEWYGDRARAIIYPKKRIENHDAIKEWYNRQLNHKEHLLLIGISDIIRIGAVYFRAVEPGVFEALLTIKISYCMKNATVGLLNQAIEMLCKKRQVKKVFMQIPDRTPASRVIFERAGMQLTNASENQLRWERSFNA